MPRPRKKTPLSEPPTTDTPLQPATPEPEKNTPKRPSFLTLSEKRKWLAAILRDTSGQHQGFEIGMGDKFKALVEDNKLAGHPGTEEAPSASQGNSGNNDIPELLKTLLETVTPPQQQHFSSSSKK